MQASLRQITSTQKQYFASKWQLFLINQRRLFKKIVRDTRIEHGTVCNRKRHAPNKPLRPASNACVRGSMYIHAHTYEEFDMIYMYGFSIIVCSCNLGTNVIFENRDKKNITKIVIIKLTQLYPIYNICYLSTQLLYDKYLCFIPRPRLNVSSIRSSGIHL